MKRRSPDDADAAALASDGEEQHASADECERFDIVSLLDAALAAYGHANALGAAHVSRIRVAEANRLQQLQRVKAAFAQSGAWWKPTTPGEQSLLVRIRTWVGHFTWSEGWWVSAKTPYRPATEAHKKVWLREGPLVHAAMLTLRWRCNGHCGWGDCDPPNDMETAEQLAPRGD